jgi:glycolate oxidase
VFPTVAAAGAAVSAITAAGLTPSLLELLDNTFLRAIEAYRPMGLDTDAGAMLLAATDMGGERAATELEQIAELCRQAGAGEMYVASDPTEGEALLQARRLAHPSIEHFAAGTFPGGNGGVIVDDLAAPRARLVELIDGISRISQEHGVLVGVVGHAGDGNLHPYIVIDRADPESVARGRVVFDEIMRLGLALGGTCTGEHGVGLLKRDWLAREMGPVGAHVQKSIKTALDPAGILNPGKVL